MERIKFLIFFQLQNRRTHYQDLMVLASHNYSIGKVGEDRGKRKNSSVQQMGLSQLVLIVNNWSFVRDNQHSSNVRQCQLSDFQVQLKISSSAFKNRSNPSVDFHFDKNAANFPYDSFVQVMRSGLTKSYIRDVRQMYEESEPTITVEEEVPVPLPEKPKECVLLKKKKIGDNEDGDTVASGSGTVSSEEEEEDGEEADVNQWMLVQEGPAATKKVTAKRGRKK